MNAIPAGHFFLPNGNDVWVMRHLIPLTGDRWRENCEAAAQAAVDRLGRRETPGVYRSHMLSTEGGLRYFTDVALTFGGELADFEI
jgi:hypothetical protein